MLKKKLKSKQKGGGDGQRETTIEDRVKVFRTQEGNWMAEIFIPFEEMSDEILPQILRWAKNKISHKNRIPVGLLSYDEIVNKEILSDGINISAKIKQTEAERGEPKLRFKNATSMQGIEYEEMTLYLDIFPVKTDCGMLEKSDLEALFEKAGVSMAQIDTDTLDRAMDTMHNDLISVKNILLAQGRFPDSGTDAEIIYNFDYKYNDKGRLIGKKKIEADKILVTKKPPRKGDRSGVTVKGKALPPENPLDFELVPQKGTKLSGNTNEIISTEPGIVRVHEYLAQSRQETSRIIVSIEPMDVLDGSETLNITTDKHLEINGGLKTGSKVISKGEVIVNGDVEQNSSIVASGSIHVKGKIDSGTLVSDGDIESEGEIHASNLQAHRKLIIKGTATNCRLVGYEVDAQKVTGCTITAGVKASIDTVSKDERGFTSLITAGLTEHLKEKIKKNNEFISFAQKNLEKFRDIFSDQIIEEATPSNISHMVVIHAKDLKKGGIHRIPREQMEAMKELLASVGPIRDLMFEKQEANSNFLQQIKRGDKIDAEILIKNKVDAPVKIDIEGVEGEIKPEDKSVKAVNKDGKIVKIPITQDDS